jgi:hypothetical protein
LVEAMRIIALYVIDECFVAQFTDHEIVRSRTWQPGSAFHLQKSALSCLEMRKLLFITPVALTSQ